VPGVQQRVAIARSLINNPQLILADEPTGALDSRTSVEIMAIFQKLNQENGITVVLVMHELDISAFADRILRFRGDASVIAHGSREIPVWGDVFREMTGAALAAIVMIFEMTLSYTVIVPMTLAVGISYGIRRSIMHDTIYTRKLTLRGEPVPEDLRTELRFTAHQQSAEGITRSEPGTATHE
jgi:energy-coupling factor transporter ATP-binding protein EcfA2